MSKDKNKRRKVARKRIAAIRVAGFNRKQWEKASIVDVTPQDLRAAANKQLIEIHNKTFNEST